MGDWREAPLAGSSRDHQDPPAWCRPMIQAPPGWSGCSVPNAVLEERRLLCTHQGLARGSPPPPGLVPHQPAEGCNPSLQSR